MSRLRRAVVGCVISLAAWPILAKAVELRDLYRSLVHLRCLTNLVALSAGLEGGESLCPATRIPYRSSSVAGASVFHCADPRNHLRYPLRLLRTGAFVQVRTDLPSFPATPGVHRLATSPRDALVFVQPGSVRIELRRKPLERRLVMPVVAVAGLLVFLIASHFAVDSSAETRRRLALTRGVAEWIGTAIRGIGRLGLWTAAMVFGFALLGIGARGIAASREITVYPEAGRLEFQDKLFGRAWTRPRDYPGLLAVAPVPFGGKRVRLYAFFASSAGVDKRFLLTVGNAEAGLAGILNRPPLVAPAPAP